MARSKKLSAHFFKIAKSANNLRKAINTVNEPPEQNTLTRLRDVGENTAYEKKVLQSFGSSVEKHFYNKLKGVSFRNDDSSSRQKSIRTLKECEELQLCREPDNKFDPNAILVRSGNGARLGYLDARLAGEVTRSLKSGVRWRCYVRHVLHEPGTPSFGVTVFMVKYKSTNGEDSRAGMSGTEFLAKYYPDYKPVAKQQNSSRKGLSWALFLILFALFAMMVHSC